jgi:non-ribosomal peptide synthetase component F
MRSMVLIDAINKNDTVVQIARCSFDVHVLDILGTWMLGASLIMLRPEGILDFDYLASTLKKKQITYIQAVPSLLRTFFTFLTETGNITYANCLRSLCSSGKRSQNETYISHTLLSFVGEPCSTKLLKLLASCITEKCNIWNLYGPAETIICTYHQIHPISNREAVPIGRLMPNYQCLILDEFLQNVAINQEGELYMGGIGVYAGYLGRDDLTAKALLMINDKIFYRTGDLVRLDNNGLLYYIGRKDHQIKLHGQRIELGEIEQCLLETSITSCVVIQWSDEHLVAYVESSDMNEEQLFEHCRVHLPPHMMPSLFIVLEKLPLRGPPPFPSQKFCLFDSVFFSYKGVSRSPLGEL